MKRLVLAGGGHAHLLVLEQLARRPARGLDVTLLTPSPWQHYSGMLPGWIVGHYDHDRCRVDIRPLAARAGVTLTLEPVVAMDADRNIVCLSDGRHVSYDTLSLDIGGETNSQWLAGLQDRLLTVKPLDAFQTAWTELLVLAKEKNDFHLVVVGGGAAGIELALAAQSALRSVARRSKVTLTVGQSGLLAGHGDGVRARVERALARAGIDVNRGPAVGIDGGVLLSSGTTLPADRVIAATGARAPIWLRSSRLALDREGFIAVDPFQRSLSHGNVFAVGDVASRRDIRLARSGVHAVRAGPVLAHNLSAVGDGRPLRPYRPKRASLYLLISGKGTAIASWGRWSAEGTWVWHWKDWIDRRFMRRFGEERSTEPAP